MKSTRNQDDTISAGSLRQRVTFLRRHVQMQSGIATETWKPEFSCWASVEPITGRMGRMYYEAAAIHREHDVKFTIRFRRDVQDNMQIEHEGVQYQILTVLDPGMRKAKLEIIASNMPQGGG